MDTHMKPHSRNRQRGAVLVIALLFLTILTILGVTAMTATTFEEKMAGHTRDAGIAFQAAEAALRDARRDINAIEIVTGKKRLPEISGKTGFGDGSADADNGTCGANAGPGGVVNLGLCRPNPYDGTAGVPPIFNSAAMTGPRTVEYGTFTGVPPLSGVSRQPNYFIEVMCLPQFGGSLGDSTFCNFYRISARGYGNNPNTQVTVQEIFLKIL
jgi:type IV pilus assembly protein PilX